MSENTTTKTVKTDSNVEALRRQADTGLFSTGVIKHEQVEKDWSYLASKEPASNHELQARLITDLSGVEISAKQCMALLAMHRWIQKTEANQKREGFHGRTVESVLKGSETLAERVAPRLGEALVTHRVPVTFVANVEEAHAEAIAVEAKPAPAKPARKAAPRKAPAKKAEVAKVGEF